MNEPLELDAVVPNELSGWRVDAAAAELFSDYSRARLQQWIKDGELTVNGEARKPKDKVMAGDVLDLQTTLEIQGEWQAQDIEFEVVYEDDELLVINKPAGLTVHPGNGAPDGTLLNGLLHWNEAQGLLPRAGIVHRLDKDTSGLMVVARTLPTYNYLIEQLKDRAVKRQYEAIVSGNVHQRGIIDEPIGRHSKERTKMAVVAGGKPAISKYEPLENFANYAHVQVQLQTGRTHQIRVHMAHIGHPLLGDSAYGYRLRIPAHANEELVEGLTEFKRQALHANELGLIHPKTKKKMRFQAEPPEDFLYVLGLLQEHGEW